MAQRLNDAAQASSAELMDQRLNDAARSSFFRRINDQRLNESAQASSAELMAQRLNDATELMTQRLIDAAQASSAELMFQRLNDAAQVSSTIVMAQRLKEAAQEGNIEELYNLIELDPFVLEKVDNIPFSDTPLHVAIRAKKTHFAKEVASLKPSFAGKLNQYGLSPMHLATETGQVEMVEEFLTMNPKLCLLKSREKRIPLHCAAAAGTVNVMEKLLVHCPESILELTIQNETAIHLAAKENQLEAFKMLLEWLEKLYIEEVDTSALEIALKSVNSKSLRPMVGRVNLLNKDDFRKIAYSFGLKENELDYFQNIRETLKKIKKKEVLSWKDEEGNTVLHLATSSTNSEMIKLIIGQDSISRWEVDVNATNASGQTALDVLFVRHPRDEARNVTKDIPHEGRDVTLNIPERDVIENILHQAGAQIAAQTAAQTDDEVTITPNAPTRELKLVSRPLTWKQYLGFNTVSPSDERSAMLVVVVLIATATFQAGLSPPRGVWQDNSPNSNTSSLEMPHRAGTTILPTNQSSNTSSLEMPHSAGIAILATKPKFFIAFVLLNNLGFVLSLFMINLLTEGFPLQFPLTVALGLMYVTYSSSIYAITPDKLLDILYWVLATPPILTTLAKTFVDFKVRRFSLTCMILNACICLSVGSHVYGSVQGRP